MFRKPIQCNCFIYFGVIVSEGELKTAMKRMHKNDDVYAFIFGNGLQFQRIGNSKKSSKFIIGKEIYNQYAFTSMKLNFDENNQLELLHNNGIPINIQLDKDTQQEITKKIYALGFFNLTGYHMIHNYETNNVG